MYLSELAKTVESLEKTTSRRTMVELVAKLLDRVSDDERAPVVYLLQGRLRPAYEPIDVGLAERSLSMVVGAVYGASEAAVARRLAKSGDVGLVAEALAPKAAPRKKLTVREAYDGLLAVAHATGKGAFERKRALMAALLERASGTEAKLLVRVAQGRLRLGVGDQTIMQAAASAAFGDGRKKTSLEHAYNVRSDLGGVVALAFAKGERALTTLGPKVGIPVRPALAQRLPSAAEIIEKLGAVQAEPKYDGFRLQLHRNGDVVHVYSRRLEDVTESFPDLADGLRRRLRAKTAIIEGEALVEDPETGEYLPFQVTITRKRKTKIAEEAERLPLRLFAFDLLFADGKSYLNEPQRERSGRLRALLPSRPGDAVRVTDAEETDDADELQRYFDEMVGHGLEGILAKKLEAPYQPGSRGYDWVKLKKAYQSALRDTVDVVIVGYLRGRGKRAAAGIGSLLAAVYDPSRDLFRTVAKIGSGLTESAWRELRSRLDADAKKEKPARVDSIIVPDVWVEPRYVLEVLADEISRSPRHTCGRTGDEPGYALRFPRVVGGGIRADKAPADATTEQEILQMYQQQRAPSATRSAGKGRRTKRSAKTTARTTAAMAGAGRSRRG